MKNNVKGEREKERESTDEKKITQKRKKETMRKKINGKLKEKIFISLCK